MFQDTSDSWRYYILDLLDSVLLLLFQFNYLLGSWRVEALNLRTKYYLMYQLNILSMLFYAMKANFAVTINLVIFFFNVNCPFCSCKTIIILLILKHLGNKSFMWLFCDITCGTEEFSQLYFDKWSFEHFKYSVFI